jgi:hypothetical protein
MLPHLRLFRNDFSLCVHAIGGRTATDGHLRRGRSRLVVLVENSVYRPRHLRRSSASFSRALLGTHATAHHAETVTTIPYTYGMMSRDAGGLQR